MEDNLRNMELLTEEDKFGPQLVGLFIDSDRQKAIDDERTIAVSGGNGELVPIFTPIENNSEINPVYFKNADEAYFFNASELLPDTDLSLVIGKLASLSSGAMVVFEQIGGDKNPSRLLEAVAEKAGKTIVLDEGVIDDFNGSLAAVHHFYSPITFSERPTENFRTLAEAHKWLDSTGEWQEFAKEGLGFVNGIDMTPELMNQLWEVYDETFDVLVSNHPSAQKQPKDDFFHQCQLPESNITYAFDGDEICSALFLVDSVEQCYWLNSEYFKSVNPSGDTVFVPGISTRIDKQGMSLSPRIIRAMAKITSYVPSVTGFATQCTNRSVDYIPEIAEKATEGNANLKFKGTTYYEYPVFKIMDK